MRKFIANRVELESKLKTLLPVISLVKGYTFIAERVSKEAERKITTQAVYRMFNKFIISDEYICRLVIKHSNNFVGDIENTIKQIRQ